MNSRAKILSLLRPYSRYLLQALLIFVLVTVLSLPGPSITKLLLDNAYPHRDYGLLQFLLVGGAGFGLFLGFVQVNEWIFRKTSWAGHGAGLLVASVPPCAVSRFSLLRRQRKRRDSVPVR